MKSKILADFLNDHFVLFKVFSLRFSARFMYGKVLARDFS